MFHPVALTWEFCGTAVLFFLPTSVHVAGTEYAGRDEV